MKTIVIDLDYTILDSKRFRDECLAPFFFSQAADPAREFNAYYEKNFKSAGKNFDPGELLEKFGLTEAAFDTHLKNDISSFLIPGAENFLRIIKEKSDQLVLASFGNKNWQDKKIDYLTINGEPARTFFDIVIIEEKDKATNEILNSIEGDEFEIINDNLEEIKKMSQAERFKGKTNLHLVEGPYSKETSEKKKIDNGEDSEIEFTHSVDVDKLGRKMYPDEYRNELNAEVKHNQR